jgi:ABC-type phosphate transport system permease subunit
MNWWLVASIVAGLLGISVWVQRLHSFHDAAVFVVGILLIAIVSTCLLMLRWKAL